MYLKYFCSLANVVSLDSFGIVIYIGDTDIGYIEEIGKEISELFPVQFEEGKIEIISPPNNYYPDFDTEIADLIKNDNDFNTFGDPADRIKWRQKQNLGT